MNNSVIKYGSYCNIGWPSVKAVFQCLSVRPELEKNETVLRRVKRSLKSQMIKGF